MTEPIPPSRIARELLDAMNASSGHFLHESGHHGDLWLDPDALFLDAGRARAWGSMLARPAAACRPEVVCGPRTGGARLAELMAAELGTGCAFAVRDAPEGRPVRYRLPESCREVVRDRRVLVVDDAVNAGSALRATLAGLRDAGASVAGFTTLLALGGAAREIAGREQAPLFALASLDRGLWAPGECPLCASGTPLVDRLGAASPRPAAPPRPKEKDAHG